MHILVTGESMYVCLVYYETAWPGMNLACLV